MSFPFLLSAAEDVGGMCLLFILSTLETVGLKETEPVEY